MLKCAAIDNDGRIPGARIVAERRAPTPPVVMVAAVDGQNSIACTRTSEKFDGTTITGIAANRKGRIEARTRVIPEIDSSANVHYKALDGSGIIRNPKSK